MTRIRALASTAFLALSLAVAAPALAQEDHGDGTTTTEASTPAEETAPAIVVEIGEEAPESEAWTFRYLVPTFMALTAIAVLATLIGYVLRVRARYVVRR